MPTIDELASYSSLESRCDLRQRQSGSHITETCRWIDAKGMPMTITLERDDLGVILNADVIDLANSIILDTNLFELTYILGSVEKTIESTAYDVIDVHPLEQIFLVDPNLRWSNGEKIEGVYVVIAVVHNEAGENMTWWTYTEDPTLTDYESYPVLAGLLIERLAGIRPRGACWESGSLFGDLATSLSRHAMLARAAEALDRLGMRRPNSPR